MKKTLPNGLAATALLLLPGGLLAQMTGTSHPEDLNDSISTAPAAHYVKPSPAVPLQPAPGTQQFSAPAPVQITTQTTVQSPMGTTGSATPVLIQRAAPGAPGTTYAPPAAACIDTSKAVRPDGPFGANDDPNAGVVIDVASAPNELPAGTLLHTGLSAEVSTVVTQRGDAFTARLLQPLARHKEVLLPAGSLVSGRVAEVHAGNRWHGGPAIQLIPEFITLPDGTRHRLEAQVVDLPAVSDANVNSEGVIRGKDHLKQNVITAGALTGTATVAGAMMGGGVGAAVGATVGAGVATVWWLKHEQEQTIRENTEIVFSLDRPLLLAPATR